VDGRFDRQSIKNVVQFISNHFIKKGYYQVRVIAGPLKKEKDSMHQSFDIQKGTKYRKPLFIFQGNRLIPRKRLYRFLKALKLNDMVFTQPDEVARQLLNYYRGQGFMTARIGEPQIRFHPSPVEVTVTIPVSEGLLFKIAKITISGGVAPAAHGNNKGYSKQKKSSQKSKDFLKSSTGSRGLDETTLLKTLSVKKGQVFSTKKLNDARYEIAAAYTGQGYHNVRVTYEQHVSKEEGSVDLIFRVEEGPRGIIQEIEISGNVVTRMAVIRREITFKEGDVLDFREINKSRKKLYDLGIFKRVNIEIEDLPVDNVSGKRQRVVIRLLEPRPFQVKTGLQWNTETAFGAVLELNNANIAGKSHYSGTSFSIDGKESNFKTYYRFPYFLGKKMATEFYLFAGKKTIPTFSEKRRGFTVQQQLRPGKGLLFSWSYTWKRAHTFDLSAADFPPTGLEFKLNLAYVTTTFSYDRRNSLVNPTRGMFFSLSLQHAAALLGSDAGFSRLYGEYNRYLLIKGFLVGATSVKIGLGQGLGQANLPGERFYAGGSTTMRGFNKNSLGPLNPETGLPSGGEALFIFKQEIRARLHKLFSLVLFADLGNVYQSAADFDIFDVRKSIGFGIRLHIAPLLLRIDWGFKLDRRPDESPSHIYLSIGQAF
jgi:outer membrane protein assembly complex protein YaeT